MVKFGLAYGFRNPPHAQRPFADLYEEAFQQIAYAEELGYDFVWLTEHHFVEDGYCPSLLPVAAAIAARTQRIRIGTYVFLLPLHNALRVAEDVAVVDCISDGRMELGVGTGYRFEEFAAFGVDRRDRKTLMDEGCEILLRSWTEDHWSFEGRHYNLENVSVYPKPIQKPHPPLWISARGPAAARRAARFRSPLLIAPPAYTTGEGEQVLYDTWADGLRAQGEDPARYHVGGTFICTVTDDAEGALERRARRPQGGGQDWMSELYATWYSEAGDLPSDRAKIGRREGAEEIQARSGVVGDPETVIGGIEDLLKRGIPYTHLLAGGGGEWLPDGTNPSMEAFAKHVMPHFQDEPVAARP